MTTFEWATLPGAPDGFSAAPLAYTIRRPVVDRATFLRCPRWCEIMPIPEARERLADEPEALAALDSVPGAVGVRMMDGDRDGDALRLSVMVLHAVSP